MPTQQPIIQVENLTKIFGDAPHSAISLMNEGLTRNEILKKTGQTLGVARASFEVRKGEILVIMGLSGSGKSTLVRLINRLIEPTSGTVMISGENVTRMNKKQLRELRRHKVGMVFQRFALFPHKSVMENAAYGLEIMGVDAVTRKETAYQILELVGLKGWELKMPGELSGGMQQRVGLARAMATDPEIILMDEALSALDPLIRKDMQNEIIDLQRKLDKTVLFITHDLDEAINMGDRIILMKDGWIVQEGTAEEILTNPANQYVERFVQDVDMAKILTAQSVMKKTHEVIHMGDGPHVALHKLRESGLSTLFSVDNHGVLQGLVRGEALKAFLDSGKPHAQVGEIYRQAVKRVRSDTPIHDVVPLMAENHDPVAVVDESDRLKGVIVLGSLIAGLAESCGTSPENEQQEKDA